jgi:hypothetical protein
MDNQTLLLLGIGCLVFYFIVYKENFENTCDKDLCNTRIKEFIIDNNWSFDNSSVKFKECNACKNRWYRSSEYKTSDNGKTWVKHSNVRDAYKDIQL